VHGQKTGFFLDQRENRKLVRERFSMGEVLNVFAYTGGFTVAALMGDASAVLSIDSSSEAISKAKRNLALNELPAANCDWQIADAFKALRAYEKEGRSFDTIYLDPPRFAATLAQAHRAARGYKDINRLAFKLIRTGGILVTFSCSGGVSNDLFQKIVADAALDAKREGRIIRSLGQPGDHPVALGFPESRYLKGLVVRVE
jgi:23S rRNA (cytosine1962-C5)-methyltransferase